MFGRPKGDGGRRCPGCGTVTYDSAWLTAHRADCPVRRAEREKADREWDETMKRVGKYRCGCVVTKEGGVEHACFTEQCELLARRKR